MTTTIPSSDQPGGPTAPQLIPARAAGAGCRSDRIDDVAAELWDALSRARAGYSPMMLAAAEDSVFRFYLPLTRGWVSGAGGDRRCRVGRRGRSGRGRAALAARRQPRVRGVRPRRHRRPAPAPFAPRRPPGQAPRRRSRAARRRRVRPTSPTFPAPWVRVGRPRTQGVALRTSEPRDSVGDPPNRGAGVGGGRYPRSTCSLRERAARRGSPMCPGRPSALAVTALVWGSGKRVSTGSPHHLRRIVQSPAAWPIPMDSAPLGGWPNSCARGWWGQAGRRMAPTCYPDKCG